MPYPGGKGGEGVYQTIINQMPPHEVYVEAFAGGAAVFENKRPARHNILCELNPQQAEQLQGHARSDVSVMCYDGLRLMLNDWVAELGRPVLWYFDPPYPRSTRTKRDCYGEQEWDDSQHLEFLEMLVVMAGQRPLTDQDEDCQLAMVSTYPNPMYADALMYWRRIEFEAITRGGTMRTEHLYMNYPAPTELHDYRYYGRDRRERELLRRQGKSFARKLTKRRQRDPLAANAVLSYALEAMR